MIESIEEREALQLRIGRAIEENVLPYYRSLFPQSPRVYDDHGASRILPNPFYGFFNGVRLDYPTYVAKVSEGCIAARAIHGPMHATRVALWAGLLTVFRERHTGIKTPWLFELQMAAAFHDAGRQDEGSDEWERESERIFENWLGSIPGAGIEALAILQLKSDNCIERQILIDADILDIQRVLGADTQFDRTRLSFWNDARIPRQTKDDLIDETSAFIHLTETQELKRDIEESGAVYFHLMHELVHAHRTTSAYPILYDLLEELAGKRNP